MSRHESTIKTLIDRTSQLISQTLFPEPEIAHEFISQYQIDPEICDALIALFKQAKKEKLVMRGHIGSDRDSEVNKTIKDSYDLYIAKTPDAMLEAYRYPDYMMALKTYVDQYLQEHPILQRLGPFNIGETPIIQHYKPGGGFKSLHFERSGLSSSTRWLV